MDWQKNGSTEDPAGSAKDGLDQSQKPNAFVTPQAGSGAEESSVRSESVFAPEDLSGAIDRFSHLSSKLTEALLDLSRIVLTSSEQLESVQSAVEVKKGELKSLEAQIESERRTWEVDKTTYTENLKLQRQREEEEYKTVWDLEKAKAQQQLEEELRLLQQESKLKQEIFEQDCQRRERALKEKELEWMQLTQELEQFMARLSRRVQSHS